MSNIGHNNPPDPIDEALAPYVDAIEEAQNWLDGEPIGLCIQDDSRIERDAGHVRVLGVVPHARGRGIATWLLRSAFSQAAREGRAAMTLTVDSDNTTGATALYERAGMQPERVIILFRRPLS